VKKAGVWDDTAIIITGDHGDSFGNQGQYMDHGLSNEAVTRVPMIVRWPGVTNGGQNDGLIYTLDLCPTLCEMFGIRKPNDWDGETFKPALEGNRFGGRPYLVIDHGIYTLQRSVRTQDWMLIRTLHPGLYPYDDEFWLYDMKNDWHQTTNVAGDNPEVVKELLAMMDEWWYRNAAPNQPDPLALAIERGEFRYFTPEKMVARLRRTGRAHFADDLLNRLKKFHGSKFEHLRSK
jgi:arylsulfatase A-like enzyme